MKVRDNNNDKSLRRTWTRKEESLLNVLEDIETCGQHCDTSAFKSGKDYIDGKVVGDFCPTSSLKAYLHIELK